VPTSGTFVRLQIHEVPVARGQLLKTSRQLAVAYGLSPWIRVAGPPVRVFIFAAPRSGTSLLTDLLDGHPDIRCEGELLRHRMPRVPASRFIDARAVRSRIRHRVPGYGWKAVSGQVWNLPADQKSTFVRDLHRRGWRILVLRRQDELARAVSILQAQHRGKWHFRDDTAVPHERIVIDPAQLDEVLAGGQYDIDFINAAIEGVPHLSLTYEDDLDTPAAQQQTLDRLCAEFGLPPAPALASLVRAGATELSDRVANYDEMLEALRHTRFAAYADRTTVRR
jgi:LPS sulfotransferase NodH